MSMVTKQSDFLVKIAELILWAAGEGYLLTLGDGYRDPRLHGEIGEKKGYGHPNSFHKRRLAIDLNLFIKNPDGSLRYAASSEDHSPIGMRWEEMGGTWGGRFNDGNHYSWGEAR